MAKNKENLKEQKLRAGFTIMLISVSMAIILIISGGIWTADINDKIFYFDGNDIKEKSFKAETNLDSIDANQLFEDKYYVSLSELSNSISHGTTWLNLCGDTTASIGGNIYVKVCEDKFRTTKDVREYLDDYISKELIDVFMADYYIDYNGQLYIIPVAKEKDDTYLGLDSYKVIKKTATKIEYLVTSKYGQLECADNCEYSYKKHQFVLEKQNNNWFVSEFALPY